MGSRERFEAFRRYGIPLLAVAESIATKGQSPGSTALGAEHIFQQQEDRQRQFLKEEEEKRKAATAEAIERALNERRMAALEEQTAGARSERERAEQKALDWENAVSAEEGLTELDRAMKRGAGPTVTMQQATGIDKLMQQLAAQRDIAGQKALSAKDIAMIMALSRQNVADTNVQGRKDVADINAKSRLENTKLKSDQSKEKAETLKQDILSQIDVVQNHPGKYSGISAGQIMSNLPTEARDYKLQFNRLKDMITLENLKYLKGAMSDKDVAFIKSASSALDLFAKPEYLNKELNKIRGFVSTPGTSIPTGNTGSTSAATPLPGTIEDGYRFRGGNPSDPHNWEQVQ